MRLKSDKLGEETAVTEKRSASNMAGKRAVIRNAAGDQLTE